MKQRVASNSAKDCFPSSEVKKWAIDDLEKTISWLERQEEKVNRVALFPRRLQPFCK